MLDVPADEVVPVAPHGDPMRQYDCVSLPCSPPRLEVTLKYCRIHRENLGFPHALVDVPLPLVTLAYILVAVYHVLHADVLKFTVSPDVGPLLIHNR